MNDFQDFQDFPDFLDCSIEVFHRDRMECGFYVKRREVGVLFQQQSNHADNVGAGEGVAREVAIAATGPCGADIDARSG